VKTRSLALLLCLLGLLDIVPRVPSAVPSWWGGAVVWYQNVKEGWITGCRPVIAIVDPDCGPDDLPWTSEEVEQMRRGVRYYSLI